MGARRAAIAITVGLIIGWMFQQPKNDCKSNGTTAQKVQEYFLCSEILSHEKEGLALAAYQHEELIVDLWGGYAEKAALRPWNRDTMTVVFSSTKAIGALIIAILVTRGHLQYEDKVVKYWPEFGAHDKENITVQWILEHKAGLIVFDEELTIEQAHDDKYISKIIEKTKPKWPAGSAVGYHAITFGWLLDQLVRRTDPLKRSIAEFYQQEIQIHMKGLHEHYRIARIVQPTIFEFIRAFFTSTKYFPFLWDLLRNGFRSEILDSGTYPAWLSILSLEMPYNNPAVQEVVNVGVLGIGTARSLASVVSTIWKEKLISEEIWNRISKPVEFVHDKVSNLKCYRGYGFFYEPHPSKANAYLMYHPGHGMQNLIIDPSEKIVVAMIRNGLLWDEKALKESFTLTYSIINATS
ncbi:unnamed protein product [Thelazia callipaeda]|uniref:Beta-lactamase domain-containing protein n=1 Tax=Thelazia callipaeda TaxID=103827 RepID=A0A0N5CUC8_THECL|nr:unnamed protein product [Thelazia callipaeda]